LFESLHYAMQAKARAQQQEHRQQQLKRHQNSQLESTSRELRRSLLDVSAINM
jgi:hypothetical protein